MFRKRLTAMQTEIDALRARLDDLGKTLPFDIREMKEPEAISEPLDVHGLLVEAACSWQFYNEEADVYNLNRYL